MRALLVLATALASLAASPVAGAYIDKSQLAWEPHPGARLPGELAFVDSDARPVRLSRYFDGRPVVLVFVYLNCPELCPEVLMGVGEALRAAGPGAMEGVQVLAVSIDPRDTPAQAAARKAHLLPTLRPATHFLTSRGDDAARLARAAGFRYLYDEASGQYAHPAGFVLADGSGRITRYFPGLRFDAGELRKGLDDARQGRVSAVVRQLLLVCFHFDPVQGRYSGTVLWSLRALSIVLLAGLATVLARRLRWGRSA